MRKRAPIAIVANGLRVAGTGVAAHYYGSSVATGSFHEFSGWFVFAISFLMLIALAALFGKLGPGPHAAFGTPATVVRS